MHKQVKIPIHTCPVCSTTGIRPGELPPCGCVVWMNGEPLKVRGKHVSAAAHQWLVEEAMLPVILGIYENAAECTPAPVVGPKAVQAAMLGKQIRRNACSR